MLTYKSNKIEDFKEHTGGHAFPPRNTKQPHQTQK
jgi:hypothetical protein